MNAFDRKWAVSRLLGVACLVIVIAGLRMAQPILMPLALAILISFLLAPLVNGLERLHVGRITSVVLVTVLVFLVIIGVGYLMTNQVMSLAASLPAYKENIVEKISSLRQASTGTVDEAVHSLEGIAEEISTSQPATQPASQPAEEPPDPPTPVESKEHLHRAAQPPYSDIAPDTSQIAQADADQGMSDLEPPISVRVVEMPSHPWNVVTDIFGVFAKPLGTTIIVVVLVVFILISRQDLRVRMIRWIGGGNLQLTTESVDEISRRISRYLLAQLTVNLTYAIPAGIGLYLFGVPNALLWALLTLFLRFLPYVGPWLAASMPILLSIAVFDGWARPLGVMVMYVCFELFSNNVVEPYLYGRSTGISTFGVVLAAFFWTWLWGPMGLLLATPITVCLVVIGKNVPAFSAFDTILASQLDERAEQTVYDYLMRDELDEAVYYTQLWGRQRLGGAELCDRLIIPTLHLIERERERGGISESDRTSLTEALSRFATRLCENEAGSGNLPDDEPPEKEAEVPGAAEDGSGARRVLIVVHRDDEVAHIVDQIGTLIARSAGLDYRRIDQADCESGLDAEAADGKVGAILIAVLRTDELTRAFECCEACSRAGPDIPLVAGLWMRREVGEDARNNLRAHGARAVVTSAADAIEEVRREAGA